MTAATMPPTSTGELSRAELAHALALAADLARVHWGDDDPIVARLEAGADRIRQENAR